MTWNLKPVPIVLVCSVLMLCLANCSEEQPYLSRDKPDQLISDEANHPFIDTTHIEIIENSPIRIKKVLIIGNSITRHAPAPEIGWYGDWGMAASEPSKDFVNILMDSIRTYRPEVEFLITNKGVTFERTYDTYNIEQVFKEIQEFGADLVILRIGENIDNLSVDEKGFKVAYQTFANYFHKAPEYPLISVASFWHKPSTTRIMREVSLENDYHFIDLDSIRSQNSGTTAIGLFENNGVAIHPEDKGMALIAERIWDEVSFYFKGRVRR